MIVTETSRQIAEPFIKVNHYTGTVPPGADIFFQGSEESNPSPYCISCYGRGVNCHQAKYLAKRTGLDITNDNLTELLRLCRVGEKHNARVPMSRFLSICHRYLKQMGKLFVVSFSDPMHSHDGVTYRASNFQHLGKTSEGTLIVQPDGTTLHPRAASHFAAAHGISEKEMGLTRVKTPAKDRWFIALVLLFSLSIGQAAYQVKEWLRRVRDVFRRPRLFSDLTMYLKAFNRKLAKIPEEQ